jgi:hypothetical protein
MRRIATCWARAMEGLGWIGRGTHAGQFLRTANDAGHLPPECAPLASEKHSKGLRLSTGAFVDFEIERERDTGKQRLFTMKFSCLDEGCTDTETVDVAIPMGPWFCYGWVSGPRRHGDECLRGLAACNKERAVHGRRATPCRRHEGAAYCRGPDSCYPSPWSCWRSGPSVDPKSCMRTDR